MTKNHRFISHPDAALMIDVDLSILGKAPERFLEYETAVRKEYSWVPGFLFRRKRGEILRDFLERDRIYISDHFHDRYEQSARRNLTESVRRLEG